MTDGVTVPVQCLGIFGHHTGPRAHRSTVTRRRLGFKHANTALAASKLRKLYSNVSLSIQRPSGKEANPLEMQRVLCIIHRQTQECSIPEGNLNPSQGYLGGITGLWAS